MKCLRSQTRNVTALNVETLDAKKRVIGLWSPNEIWIIQPPFVGFEIPIFRVLKSFRMAIEKTDICSMIMKVGVDVVLLGYGRALATVPPMGSERSGPPQGKGVCA